MKTLPVMAGWALAFGAGACQSSSGNRPPADPPEMHGEASSTAVKPPVRSGAQPQDGTIIAAPAVLGTAAQNQFGSLAAAVPAGHRVCVVPASAEPDCGAAARCAVAAADGTARVDYLAVGAYRTFRCEVGNPGEAQLVKVDGGALTSVALPQ